MSSISIWNPSGTGKGAVQVGASVWEVMPMMANKNSNFDPDLMARQTKEAIDGR